MSNQTPNLPILYSYSHTDTDLPGRQYSEQCEWSVTGGNALGLLSRLKETAWRAVPWLIITCTCLAMCSCAIPRQVTQLVEHTSVDTLYLSTQQYDSIYILQDKYVDRSRDTLFIKDKSIEYRYKLLRDTIYKVQHDSIPYEVTITETKEITRPLTLYDRICRMCFWFLIGVLSLWLYNNFRKIRG